MWCVGGGETLDSSGTVVEFEVDEVGVTGVEVDDDESVVGVADWNEGVVVVVWEGWVVVLDWEGGLGIEFATVGVVLVGFRVRL